MNTRLFLYFFATFFASLGAGVSKGLALEDWVRLVALSLGAGFAAGLAYLDKSAGGPPDLQTVRKVAVAIVAAAAMFVCSGCTFTAVYGPDGKPQFKSGGNIVGLKFRGPGTSLEADSIDHATPTKAAAAGVTSAVTALGALGVGLPR